MVGIATHAASSGMLSSDVRVALTLGGAYRQLIAGDARVTWLRALARPALVLLVIATTVPIMAVQHVSLELVATAALSWSFVVAIQMLIGAAIIASAPARSIGTARALDLWFAGHVPYSLWLLVVAAWLGSSTSAPLEALVFTACAPAAWTAAIVAAFCRVVLGTTAGGARWRAAAHQVAVWGVALTYVAWSAGGWFRLVE